MRLTCPNCGAQYEVPDEVIPPGGRDVQCSNCENTWFQERASSSKSEPIAPSAPEVAADAAAPPDGSGHEEVETDIPDAPPQAASPTRVRARERSLDPAVADILRQEAALEAEMRARDTGSLESQTELGLEAPPKKVVEPEPHEEELHAPEPSKRDALPDIDEINSSLRSDAEAEQEMRDAGRRSRRSGGFVRGFALMVILGAGLFLIYGNAQRISASVPQAEPVLNAYVSIVDQARLWLQSQAATTP